MKIENIFVKFDDSGVYRSHIGEELLRLCLDIQKSKKKSIRILEIGPGSGSLMQKFVETEQVHPSLITFIEPSSENAHILLSRFPKARVINKNFETFLSSGESENFDIIFANFSLHWVESIHEQIQKISKLMSPGGLIAFTNTDSDKSFWGKMDRDIQLNFQGSKIFNIDKSHSMNEDQWLKAFEISQGGSVFKCLLVRRISGIAATFKTTLSCIENLRSVVGTKYLKLAPGVTNLMVESYIDQKLHQYANKNGEISIPASGFQIILEKS